MNGNAVVGMRRLWLIGTICDADEYQSTIIADKVWQLRNI